MIYEPLQEL